MYLRKYILNYAEEISNLFKFHFNEPHFFKIGRGSITSCKSRNVLRRHQLTNEAVNKLPCLPSELKETHTIISEKSSDRAPKAEMSNSDDMQLCGSSSDEDIVDKTPCFTEQRAVRQTPYGRSLQVSTNIKKLNNEIFSVATYNVLSQHLLEIHRYLYDNCKKFDLKWSTRSANLLKDFELLNPDVFCLQEVEEDHLVNFFEKELGRLGYTGVFKKRTHDKVDGCAIFYKTHKFDLINQKTVELYKQSVQLLDRDNIGVIVKLALKNKPKQHIVIATTHLLYTPRRTDIRLTQTQVMLAEIERVAFRGNNCYWPIIFTGDMNYTPYSVVYNLVEKGFVRYEREDIFTNKYRGNKKYLLPQRVGVTDSCQFESALQKRSCDKEEVFYGSGTLDHNLQLGSVYSHVKNHVPEATTYQEEWHTVDYIFYNQRLVNNQRVEGDLRLISLLELPNAEEAEVLPGHLPNRICGSDHLPLLATFHLPSEHSRL